MRYLSSFYNCVWLILNDAIVGYAVGAYLSENRDWIGQQLVGLTKVSLQ
jgi:phosphatidylinositol N-acetylglucosaminyltransferase subunit Q